KIPVSSQYIGKTLQETNVKQQYGITIVKITRGLLEIDIPEADEMVYPQDVWMILGNDEQISRFSNDIDVENSKTTQYEKTDIILDSYLIEPQSILCGKTILETGLKENQHCLIIGIERQGKSIMNPHYSTVLEENDLIWIVGDKKRLHKFLKNN
ncbi:MAG: TrkA C-terminal domain-containing protein, partial [Bacteroidales bacterium]|nr:TrkA C-terminal domain-containing protein [Bacteroidales bacterium]